MRDDPHPLRRYRRERGLPQTALAERTGVNKSTICRIERGTIQPSLDLLRRLVLATERAVTADEIVSWRAPRPQPPTRPAGSGEPSAGGLVPGEPAGRDCGP